MNIKDQRIKSFIFCILFFGGLMADHTQQNRIEWITITDSETKIQADFPYEPLEMSFNTPPQLDFPPGAVRLYSVPFSQGLFVLSTFKANNLPSGWLNKETLLTFFTQVLVPHFFYDRHVFHNQQFVEYYSKSIDQFEGGIFHISYIENEVEKKIEGYASLRNNVLYVYFYLASANAFDLSLLKKFVMGIKLPHSSSDTVFYERIEQINAKD